MLYCFYFPLENIYKSGSVPGRRDHIFKPQHWPEWESSINHRLANKPHKRPCCYSGPSLCYPTITIRDKHTYHSHHHHYRRGIKAFSWHSGFLLMIHIIMPIHPMEGKGPADIISVCTSVWGGITSFTEVNKGELNGHGCLTFLFMAFKARTDLWFIQAWAQTGWSHTKR